MNTKYIFSDNELSDMFSYHNIDFSRCLYVDINYIKVSDFYKLLLDINKNIDIIALKINTLINDTSDKIINIKSYTLKVLKINNIFNSIILNIKKTFLMCLSIVTLNLNQLLLNSNLEELIISFNSTMTCLTFPISLKYLRIDFCIYDKIKLYALLHIVFNNSFALALLLKNIKNVNIVDSDIKKVILSNYVEYVKLYSSKIINFKINIIKNPKLIIKINNYVIINNFNIKYIKYCSNKNEFLFTKCIIKYLNTS